MLELLLLAFICTCVAACVCVLACLWVFCILSGRHLLDYTRNWIECSEFLIPSKANTVTHIHTHSHTIIDQCIHVYKATHIYTNTYTYICMYIRACGQQHPQKQTRFIAIGTHTHTYAIIYTHMYEY